MFCGSAGGRVFTSGGGIVTVESILNAVKNFSLTRTTKEGPSGALALAGSSARGLLIGTHCDSAMPLGGIGPLRSGDKYSVGWSGESTKATFGVAVLSSRLTFPLTLSDALTGEPGGRGGTLTRMLVIRITPASGIPRNPPVTGRLLKVTVFEETVPQ